MRTEVFATALYEIVKNWRNFYEGLNELVIEILISTKDCLILVSIIYEREEWGASQRCRPSDNLQLPINHLIFDHTDSVDCLDFVSLMDFCVDEEKAVMIS
jgi:hypothetical protein